MPAGQNLRRVAEMSRIDSANYIVSRTTNQALADNVCTFSHQNIEIQAAPQNLQEPQPNRPDETPQITGETIQSTLTDINKALSRLSRGISFSVDRESRQIIINIVEEGKIIKTIPPEEILRIRARLKLYLNILGLVVDKIL